MRATDDYAAAGPQDVVILAVKAHQVDAVRRDAAAPVGPETVVVTMQNGIPFWYFHRHGGPLAGHASCQRRSDRPLAADPAAAGDRLRRLPGLRLVAPGVVRHVEGDRLPLGELDGSRSERVERSPTCFERAGFKAPVLDDIRAEIWLKLWGNLTFNPISALSHATLVDICRFPLTRELAAAMMGEASGRRQARHLVRVSLKSASPAPRRSASTRRRCCRTSRPVRAPEIDALVGSVIELGRLTGTPTPHIDAVYA